MVRTSVLGIGAAVAFAVVAGAFLLFETTTVSTNEIHGSGAALRAACSHEDWDAWWGGPRPEPDARYTVDVVDGRPIDITVPAGSYYVEIVSSGAYVRPAGRDPETCLDEPVVRRLYTAGSGTATVMIWMIPSADRAER